MRAHPGQDVVGALQRQGQRIVGLFHLVLGHGGGAVVGHGGGHHQRVGVHGVCLDRLKQVSGRGKRYGFDKRHTQPGVPGAQQRHVGAPQHTGFGHRAAHFAGGVVGDVPHRVHRLAGGPRRDHHLHALHILCAGQLPQAVVHEHALLRQAAGAHVAAGQQPGAGGDHGKAVVFQRFQIVLGDGVFQHVGVHGRSHQLGAGGGQRHGGQHIIGQAVGQLGQHVGGGRGDQHQVGGVGQRHMGHVVLEIAVKGVHDAPAVGQRLKHQRRDELGGVFGHQHMHVGAQLDQRVRHVGHLVGGNAAGDAQHNGFALQRNIRHSPGLLRWMESNGAFGWFLCPSVYHIRRSKCNAAPGRKTGKDCQNCRILIRY